MVLMEVGERALRVVVALLVLEYSKIYSRSFSRCMAFNSPYTFKLLGLFQFLEWGLLMCPISKPEVLMGLLRRLGRLLLIQ